MEPRVLWTQFGCSVTQVAEDVVIKHGSKVRPSEEAAMRLVAKHIPSIPIPELYHGRFVISNGVPIGQLYMSFVPGVTLNKVWNSFDDTDKEKMCLNIWDFVATIRTIPRPEHLQSMFCCAADGSPCIDPLLGDRSNGPMPPIHSDETLRERIFQRYVRHDGLSYADGKDLPDMLPRSDTYVFTHGDIACRNIMVDDNKEIVALLDWESAGWYPDYWEFAKMMIFSDEHDWQNWMDRLKPTPWDITGIQKARRVLF